MDDDALDFWNLYAEEGGTALEDMERILSALRVASEDSPERQSLIAAFFRAIHTFKGGARSMGFSVIESRAHLGEDLVGQIRDEGVPLTGELHAILFELVDTLWGMLHESIGNKGDVDPAPTAGLMARMEKIRECNRMALAPMSGSGDQHEEVTLSTAHAEGDEADTASEHPDDGDDAETCAPMVSVAVDDEIILVQDVEAEPDASLALHDHDLVPDPEYTDPHAVAVPEMVDEAFIFEPVDPGQLASDPLYRQIFADMARQSLSLIHEIAGTPGDSTALAARIAAEAEKLLHAARQLGFDEWIECLGNIDDTLSAGLDGLSPLFAALVALYAQDFPQADPLTLVLDIMAPGATVVADPALDPYAQDSTCASEHADLAARMMTAMGELVTSQATNRYLLQQLKDEDMVRSVESMLVEYGLPLAGIQYALRQYLGAWQEKVEHLLQIDLHAQSLVEQLQDVVMDEQVKSVTVLASALSGRVDALRAETACSIQLDFMRGLDEQVDSRTLEQLQQCMGQLLEVCVRQRVCHAQSGGPSFSVELVRSEDSVSVHMAGSSCELPSSTGDLFCHLAQDVQKRGGRLVWSIDQDSATVVFDLQLPLTMAVMDGMVLRVGRIDYVVPIAAIQRIVLPESSAVVQVSAYGASHRVLRLDNDQVVAIRHLRAGSVDRDPVVEAADSAGRQIFVIAGKAGLQSVAIPVDELLGQQQVLIRPLQGFLALMEGIVGCTLLGSGNVGMVLNMDHLLARGKQGGRAHGRVSE